MLALHVACLGVLLIACGPGTQKYILTLPLELLTGERREVVFERCGQSRLDALVGSGVTVWTEQEWAQAQKHRVPREKAK